jgi:hypothetical protein
MKLGTLIVFFFLVIVTQNIQAQDKVTISGYLSDATSGEALLYANILIKESKIGTNSNEYGFYSIDIPKDEKITLIYSYIGYRPIEKTFHESSSKTVNIKFEPEGEFLTEVEVVASKMSSDKEVIRSTQTSTVNIPIKDIKTIPSLGGEVDIIKVVQLMPGIAKGGEGGTGMFVRGGDADQNLVLLDEATVYNIGHLFGFFSVFNPDALKDLTIIKGGFPAQYGGRLSSVLDVRMKEGNNQNLHLEGGIGLLSSRLTIEAPIIKDKASFLLSGRRTYIDQVFKWAGATLPYYFYDLNAKLNYKISEKDRIFLSSYFGDDVLKFDDTDFEEGLEEEDDFDLNFGFQLGNFTQTLRWNHVYNPKLFSNLSLIHTTFNYNINGRVGENAVLVKSEIRDLGLRMDFANYISDNTNFRYGTQVILHRFRPNILSAKGDIAEFIDNNKGELRNTLESAFYANYEFQLSEKLKISTGLRLTGTAVKGRFYFNPEPRVSVNYLFNDIQSFKFSYSNMNQYMHRVSSSTIALPTDLWYPVSENVKPQSSHQIALSYNYLFEKPSIALTLETYFKTMDNLIEYKEGSNLILNDNFEDLLLQGSGNSWGVELLLRKQEGKINGWIAYTLAWSRRHFDELNNGNKFWAKYDRRHILSFVGNWKLSKRVTFSTVWEFSSGARFTPLRANYLFPNAALTDIELVPVYSKRNEFRLSSSHRLDINFVITNNPRKRFRTEWHLGAYNVYNRATPYTIRVRLDETTGQLKYEQPGLFGFIPSIAYNFSF